MNYIKLDDLEKNIKPKKFKYVAKEVMNEIFRFGIFMSCVAILIIVFVNFNVFYYAFKEKLWFEKSFASNIIEGISWESINMNNLEESSKSSIASSDNFENLQSDKYMDILESKLDLLHSDDDKTIYEKDLNKYLKNKLKDYSLDFNLLPPDKRIEIPEIEVNAPILDITYTTPEKIKNADYDEELYKWVVKYPFTPDPNHKWAVLIFGHTSYYWWKKNPYWEVFAKIPLLKTWSKIKMVWWGSAYDYEVIDKLIKTPNQVAAEYEKYKDDKYLILMWCYPIGTSSKRMMIIAKQINLDNK